MGKETGLGVIALAAVGTTLSVLELVHSLQMGNRSVGSVIAVLDETKYDHSSCNLHDIKCDGHEYSITDRCTWTTASCQENNAL